MKHVMGLVGLAIAAGLTASSSLDAKAHTPAASFEMKRCVNMGNALEAPSGAPWGRLYSQEDSARIAAAGFDTVRIPVRWSD